MSDDDVAASFALDYEVIRHKLLACVTAEPPPRYALPHVWLWQCDAGSPSSLMWNDAELVGAVVVLWSLSVSYALNFWRASLARQASKVLARPGAAGRYREEISADGITSISPDGVSTYFPWSVISSVRETDQRFFLFGTGPQARLMLPKRGLGDGAALPRLRDFLSASAARSGQPS